jgi:hypothetical protein
MVISPETGKTEFLIQKVSYTGNWVISVSSRHQSDLATYSFVAYENKVDAGLHLNALDRENSGQSVSFWALIVSAVSVIATVIGSVTAIWYNRKKRKKDKTPPYDD